MPPISIGSITLIESWQIYYLIWVIVCGSLILTYNLLDSRVGRAMRCLRGGDTLVESLGVNVFGIKVACFVIAAFLAALSGWLYAHLSRFVSPTPFEPLMGIEYLMMAMVGGAGSPMGGVVGAGIVTLLKNTVQDYLHYFVGRSAGQLEIVAFACLFILFLQYAHLGVVPWLLRLVPRAEPQRPKPAGPLPVREKPETVRPC